MVYYRRRRFTRKYRPRYIRRANYTRKYKKRPAGSGEDGKRFFKLRHVEKIYSTADNIIRIHKTDDPQEVEDFKNIAQLFDKYRVNAMKLKFIPSVMANQSITNQYTPLYVIHDENHIGIPEDYTEAKLLEYENCKVKNLQRNWQYYRKMKRNIPTGSTDNIDVRGYLVSETPQPTQLIYVYGQVPTHSGDDPVLIGTLVTTYYVTAKARI